jgi:N-methylhydantoinase A
MVIEQRGVPTARITAKGFRDVQAIGRQMQQALYDVSMTEPAPLDGVP